MPQARTRPPGAATSLPWTNEPKAARLIARDPLALMIGFLLDQQVPMEWAFAAPQRLKERLGGRLSARQLAAMDPEELVQAFVAKPPLHRYPAAMARRTQKLCQDLVEGYGGDPRRLWSDGADAREVSRRMARLPGFSANKAGVVIGVLAKRLGVEVAGWAEVAPEWFSLADVDTPEALLHYRGLKRAAKQAGKWPPAT
ncbi:MAG: Fe-S cluster assembly protein HesB [Candidatus Dormibacteraeota bacterium]|nr:Fe-S cluster assembly protein HesB [Candidatus Dormibacteraeota bacterium]